jgi:putative membrane protein
MKMNDSTHTKILTAVLGLGLCANAAFSQETPADPGRDRKGNQSSTGSQSNTNSAEQFVREATWCGLKEIRLSEIALRKTQDPEVRTFAHMMVTDHTRANEELRQIAQRKGIQVPAANSLETNFSSEVTETGRDRATDRANRDQSTDRANRDRLDDTSARRGVREQAGSSTNQFNQAEGRESVLRAIRQLERASESEFDRLYLRAMVQDHDKAVQKFEQASQQSTDPDIKQFATTTLSKLREHQQQVQRLAQSKNVTANEGSGLPEPRR